MTTIVKHPHGLMLRVLILLALVLGLASACARTVNDHLREAESGAPEAIGEAIQAIGDLLARKERSKLPFDEGDRAAVDYLRETALTSALRVHRSQAVSALGELQTVDASDVFLKTLDDAFWLARLNAVRSLRNHPSEAFVEPLASRYDGEKRIEIRVEIVKALGVIGGEQSVRKLFDVFLGSRGDVERNDERVHAYFALAKLTRLGHRFEDTTSWEEAFKERFPPAGPGGASAPPSEG